MTDHGRVVGTARLLTVALLLVAVSGLLVGSSERVTAPLDMVVGLAIGFTPVGLFLLRGLPGHPVAGLTLASGILALAALGAIAWSATVVGAWLTQWLWFPAVGLIPLTLLTFPDGIGDRVSRRVAGTLATAVVVGTVLLAVAAAQSPRGLATGGAPGTPTQRLLVTGVLALSGVLVLGTLWVIARMLRRVRRTSALGRRQLASLLPAAALLVPGLALDAAGAPFALVPAAIALPLGMGAAVLRFAYRDLDLVVNRTMVWLVMTVLLILVFGAVVTGVTALLPGANLLATALTTGLVAATFDPVRRRVDASLRRLLFGDRDSPELVLATLSRQMRQAAEPRAMLTALVVTVTEALQVPYARLVLDAPSGSMTVAEHGRVASTQCYSIGDRGELGGLEVSPRRTGEAFTRAEDELLNDVAAAAAVAIRAHRLTLELHAARQALVLTREEERLRIRRDLHDGLGPALVGSRMQVRAVQAMVSDPHAEALLTSTFEDLSVCSAEVRRIVDGLRPPALDAGLGPALHALVRSVLPTADTHIDIAGDLAGLPPAVDVAVYRIAAEALANVARHADARRVRLHVDRDLTSVALLVADDGRGGAHRRPGGVGLGSMQARVAELGGRLEIHSEQGTQVRAVLPLAGG